MLPLRWTPVLLALVLCQGTLIAQDEEDTLPAPASVRELLQCRAGWWAGDTMRYTVRGSQRKTQDGVATAEDEHTYTVRIAVLDSSSQGYQLSWQREAHEIGRYRHMLDPTMSGVLDTLEAMRIFLRTDTAGVLLGVEDYDQVTDRWMDLQERIINYLVQARPIDHRAEIAERLERWRANRVLMSKSLLEDISTFFFPYGSYVYLDSAYTTPYDMPNTVTGGMVPGEATINLVHSDGLTYRIDVDVRLDPERFKEILRTTMNEMRRMNKERGRVKRDEVPLVDVRLGYAFVLGSEKSWPQRFYSTMTTQAEGIVSERTVTISLGVPTEETPLTVLELDADIEKFPNDPEAYRQRGFKRARKGDIAGGVEDYSMAISLDSAHAYTWLMRAWALRDGNQHLAALADAERALALDSTVSEFHQAHGRILCDIHRYPEAEISLRKALALDSAHLPSLFALGYLLKELYRFEEALETYDRAVAAYPDVAAAFGHRASARFHLMTTQQDSLALIDLRHALTIEPDDVGSLTALGNHYLDVPLFDSAAYYFDRAIILDPNDATAMHNRGYARMQQGRLDEAIGDMRESLEMDSTMTFAYNNIGWALHLAGRSEEGLANIDISISRMPTNSFAFYNRGRVLAALGRNDEACAAWRHARDIGFQKAYGDAVEKALQADCGH